MLSVSINKFFVIYISLMFFSSLSFSGVKPAHTREVIGIDKEYKVDIINTSKEKYLVQAWLEDLDGNTNNLPIILTPPIFEMEGVSQGIVRLLPIAEDLSKSRETVFWLNIQEIPQKAKNESKNVLKMALRSRIKVFVRPEGLNFEGFQSASEQLVWTKQYINGEHFVVAKNNSPYFFSLGLLKAHIDEEEFDFPDKFNMVPPFGEQKYLFPDGMSEDGEITRIEYGVINDFGAVSKIFFKIIE